MTRRKALVTRVRAAGDEHQVVTVVPDSRRHRREPCGGCPWRVDQTGEFPAEAFLHSAETAYDMSSHAFACHGSGTERSSVCAGFLLNGSAHNMSVRLGMMNGTIDLGTVTDGGHDLHEDYRAMAVANGCDPDAPELRNCR